MHSTPCLILRAFLYVSWQACPISLAYTCDRGCARYAIITFSLAFSNAQASWKVKSLSNPNIGLVCQDWQLPATCHGAAWLKG
jgi:hypothetical protein